ncbi:translocation/assembly module TamB domain-containing protein [uncultured Methylophaga sp.]|uniref:translocation/assembly module TamB domain-containing protein n=1 Tax=uncultured Methylophaga sp. TaxID=285271 RepID=UPI00260CB358|nr:translocation/assembly module TamB domain-containing protein [uncultured Methylophaga sp.]
MLKKLLLTFAALILLLVLAAGWLLATQSGLNTAISLAQKALPALQVGEARGRLIDSVTLSEVDYRPEQASGAEIDSISLRWQPMALLKATVHVQSLQVSGVDVFTVAATEPESEPESTAISLPDIQLPVQIQVDELAVGRVTLIDENGDKTPVLNTVNSQLTAGYEGLNIKQFEFVREDISADLNGTIQLQNPYPASLNYQVTLKQVLPEAVQLAGQINGNLERLTLQQTVSGPLNASQEMVVENVLNDLRWSFNANAEAIDLAAIVEGQQTRFEQLNLQASGNLEQVKAQLQSRVLQPDLPVVSVSADVESDNLQLWQLGVETAISEDKTLNLSGTVDIAESQPQADLQARWQNLSWPLTGEQTMVSSANGSLSFKGSPDDYQASLDTIIDWQQQQIELLADTSGSLQQLTIESLKVAAFDGTANANGMINWASSPLQYQLDADWQGMTLPPEIAGRLVSLEQGQVALTGNPEQLSLSASSELSVDEIAAAIQIEGQGDTASGFEQSKLNIKLAEGSINYEGPIRWAGESLLNGQLKLTDTNPGVLATGWPGQLSGQMGLDVRREAETIQLAVNKIAVEGQLRNRPLQLAGNIQYQDTLIDVSGLTLNSGRSTLSVSGQLRESLLDFNWALQSPDLEDFYPALKGSLNAEGQLGGTLEKPEIQAKLEGKQIAYQAVGIEQIDGDLQLALSDNADLGADIAITGLNLPQFAADSLQLKLSGQQQQHKLAVTLDATALSLELEADGSLNEAMVWQGELAQLAFSNEQAGQWQLVEQGVMTLSAESQTVPQHCWGSDNGRFCIEASHDGTQWQVSGDFDDVPLALFEGFAAQLEQLEGSLRGEFNLASDASSEITGAGEIFLDDASLQLNQSALNQQKPLPLNNVSLRYQLDASQTTASFHLEPQLDGVSAIDAEIETASLKTLTEQPDNATLRGSVTSAVKDLSQLQLDHPAFGDLKGQLDIDIQLAGTVTQPQINGKVSLQQGQVAVVDAGIVLKQIEANIDGDLDQVDFNLQAQSGQGSLNGEGQFTLTDQSWQLTTQIKGQQLEVMNTPEALVIAEPDLAIDVTPKKTLVKGKVHIPKAQLEPKQFNSSVSPSRDVVVVTQQEENAESGAVTEVDVTVSLGDSVQLQAMGFQGRLAGELRVFGNTNDILLGNGEINIKDGTYLAYRQLLHVDDGSIRFAGGAIDNPELDIKAVRKGKEVKAGLHIQGYASAPQAELFSDPEMSQDNILAYLILGKPVDQASATDAALLASAATGMGLQNGAMIGDQIASTFGLDEFSITGDSAESAGVQVGKYLSPKLYLSYGIGVFESVSTVELRYQLSKIWSLKAESGTESGVDLLYTYERGGPE